VGQICNAIQHETHPGIDAAADRRSLEVLVVLVTVSACKEDVLQ